MTELTADGRNSTVLQQAICSHLSQFSWRNLAAMSLSSSPSGSATINVPIDHVSLVLRVGDSSKQFYLQIPLQIINSLCLTPRKYLIYLGWCILWVEGQLAFEHGGNIINTDGELENQGVYYYVVTDGIGTFKFSFMYTECLCILSVQRRSRLYC